VLENVNAAIVATQLSPSVEFLNIIVILKVARVVNLLLLTAVRLGGAIALALSTIGLHLIEQGFQLDALFRRQDLTLMKEQQLPRFVQVAANPFDLVDLPDDGRFVGVHLN